VRESSIRRKIGMDSLPFEGSHHLSGRSPPKALFAILISVMMASSALFIFVDSRTSSQAPHQVIVRESFVTHTYVVINGDTDFASQATSEGWPGKGTAKNPYIISGYDIDGFGWHDSIRIENTTVYFVVSDCYLHAGVSGLVLVNAQNGVIDNNTCDDVDEYGIFCAGSPDLAVLNNNCTNYMLAGIRVEQSTSVTIRGNYCEGWGASCDGISLYQADSNTIVNNTCVMNGFGISVAGGSNTVLGNNCSDNYRGIHTGLGPGNQIVDNLCLNNTQGILAGATLDVVQRNTCVNPPSPYYVIGIWVAGEEVNVSWNTIIGGGTGIVLEFSRFCEVFGNAITDVSAIGIHLDYDISSNVSGNLFGGTIACGISVETAVGARVFDNDIASIGDYGLMLSSANPVSIESNSFRGQSCGVLVSNSQFVTLDSNTLIDEGIVLVADDLLQWVTHSISESNTVNGLPVKYIVDGSGGTVSGTYGEVILANCRNMVVRDLVIENASAGVSLGFCTGSSVVNATCTGNAWAGIYLEKSSGCSVTGSFSLDNPGTGIKLISASRNEISNNTILRNGVGMILENSWPDYSNENLVRDNNCSLSSGDGILLTVSSSNNITCNTLYSNSGYGLDLQSVLSPGGLRVYCGYNVIWNNSFIYNHGSTDVNDSSHVQAFDGYPFLGSTNRWDLNGRGNYWADFQTPDDNLDGIVDVPYDLDGGPARDNYPLTFGFTEPIPLFTPVGLMVFVLVGAILCIGMRTLAVRRRMAD
jgi:parallel beta-helix repeat protein